ncbi:MAG: hypothetical protein ACKVX7_04030 [Planctomycetota bacterium]
MSESLPRLLLLAHLAATLFMTGLIWFVQVVHYPLFPGNGETEFANYHRRHAGLTTWVVGPPMLIEGATALLLFWYRPAQVAAWQLWTGMTLLAVIWLSTALLQVPCHEALSRGFDSLVHERLVQTNWLRTAAWTLRGLLALWMLGRPCADS